LPVISIVVTVSVTIVISMARTVKIASSPVIVRRPSPINIDGVIPVIVARGGAVNPDVQGGSGNRRRADHDLTSGVAGVDGVNAPSQCEDVRDAKTRQQD
jgi:hypothetical protein